RWLCETACGLEGQEFLDELKQPATVRMVAHLDSMVQRYRNGEPLAYVLGRWSFRTIEIVVDRRVLIPRPETEVVAGRAIELARMSSGSRRVADLGTGSGAIGLSMAAELPLVDTEVWVTDLSEDVDWAVVQQMFVLPKVHGSKRCRHICREPLMSSSAIPPISPKTMTKLKMEC
ncbi:MAG: protein methyltransferase HemK, partial [Actinomycetota bacterium]